MLALWPTGGAFVFIDSTISHLGFMLLSLSISSVESIQAFLFYLTQYSISNLNAFIILIAIGWSLLFYSNGNKEHEQLKDKINSPIQLVNQLKGYFYINSFLALSLAITIFSFAGIPPLMGFFAKQMVLSAALDKGYIFLSLVAIITSVIGAVYYLNIIKEMFFHSSDYKYNSLFKNWTEFNSIYNNNNIVKDIVFYNNTKTTISSFFSFSISTITLIILLFIFGNKEWLSMGTINRLFFLCAKEHSARNLLLPSNTNKIVSDIYLNSSISSPSFILPQQAFGYHSTVSLNKTHPISPWFITGYSDAEGCFNVGLQKNPNGKFYVRPSFLIQVHSKDNLLLMQIKDYLGGIGNIYTNSEVSRFTVRSLDDILKIILHFDNYPLITQKKSDFILFKQIIDKMVQGEHLSYKGLQEIINIRASINLGISNSLKTIFPNTIPVARPLIENITIPHPEWMTGFVSGAPKNNLRLAISLLGGCSKNIKKRVSLNKKLKNLYEQYCSTNFYSTNIAPTKSDNTVHSSYTLEGKNSKSLVESLPSSILELNGLPMCSDLVEWLRGFTDAEGCFYIDRQSDKKVYFVFTVQLHKDDAPLLLRLRDHFNIGKVSLSLNRVNWICRNQNEARVLIDIFSKNPLNTTKHLNFVIWKEAFELYTNRTGKSCSSELMTKILALKDEMNKKRTNFNMPTDHTIRITDYWFLGFVEGEGSFYVLRNRRLGLGFSISQAIIDKAPLPRLAEQGFYS